MAELTLAPAIAVTIQAVLCVAGERSDPFGLFAGDVDPRGLRHVRFVSDRLPQPTFQPSRAPIGVIYRRQSPQIHSLATDFECS
jgi:hypothetical protein